MLTYHSEYVLFFGQNHDEVRCWKTELWVKTFFFLYEKISKFHIFKSVFKLKNL